MMMESEHILEFIDGSLDEDVEQQLFDAMARQPELRTTLRQFIMIGEGVRSDREAFIPPLHVERALLAGLGLVPVAGVAVSEVVSAGWIARFAALGSKFWPVVAAFVTGATLAGGGTYMATKSDDGVVMRTEIVRPAVEQPIASQPTISQPLASQAQQNAAPSISTSAVPMQSSQPQMQSSPRSVSSASASRMRSSGGTARNLDRTNRTSSDVSDQTALATQTDQPAETITPVDKAGADVLRTPLSVLPQTLPNMDRLMDSAADELRRQAPQHGASTVPEMNSADNFMDRLPKLMVEGRWQLGQEQIVSNNARQAGSTFLNDKAFGVYFAIGNSPLMIGGEMGVERYAQTLPVYRGDTAVVEQMPSYGWFGASARYNFGALPIIPVQTFLQVTGGANIDGGIVRLRAGGILPVFSIGKSRLALSASYEASSLVYSFNNQPQLAGRYGFTGGLSFLW
jgi:hypothetical protein